MMGGQKYDPVNLHIIAGNKDSAKIHKSETHSNR